MKVKCLYDIHRGTSLEKDKIYDARDCGKGWYAIVDESGEEFAYPPELFDVIEETTMRIKYIGKTSPLVLTNGKVYNVLSIEKRWLRVVDDSGEDYLYAPELFEVVQDE